MRAAFIYTPWRMNMDGEACKPGSVPPGDSGLRLRGLPPALPGAVTICLAPALPPGSSDQPEGLARLRRARSRASPRPPIWSCSGWGLPTPPVTRGCGELLPHLFTLARTPVSRGRWRSGFCGTFRGVTPLGVTQHPARWSPDFPPPRHARGAVTRPPHTHCTTAGGRRQRGLRRVEDAAAAGALDDTPPGLLDFVHGEGHPAPLAPPLLHPGHRLLTAAAQVPVQA